MTSAARRLLAGGCRAYCALRRRFWDDLAFSHLMVDLVVDHHPYLSPNALLLSPAEARLLCAASEALGRAFGRAVETVLEQASPEEVGWPWAAFELARQHPAWPDTTPLGRLDWVQDREGRWWVLEFNSDTPSGVREADGAEAWVARHLGLPGLSSRLLDEVARAVAERCAAAGICRPRLGIVSEVAYLEDYAQALFMGQRLAPACATVVVGDPSNLTLGRRGVRLCGQPVDALYRIYAVEQWFGAPRFPRLLERALAGEVLLLNDLRTFMAQNKALLAWLSSGRVSLPPDEAAVVRRHLPETTVATALPRGAGRDVVVKEFFGREGAEVYLGSRLRQGDWEEVRRWGTFVAQRRVHVQPLQAVDEGARGPYLARRRPCVGVFVCHNRFAGCYSRLGGPVTERHAQYAATLLDAEGEQPSNPPMPRGDDPTLSE